MTRLLLFVQLFCIVTDCKYLILIFCILIQELELAHTKAEDNGEQKIQESASRDTLENEISALRSEISSLKQKGCSGSII